MQRLLLVFLLLTFFFFGCNQENDLALQVNVTLANNPEKQVVYLDIVEFESVAPRTLDTMIIEAGEAKFSLKAKGVKDEKMYQLRFQKDNIYALLVSDQSKIDFRADWKDFGKYTVSSPASQSMKSLLTGFNTRLAGIDNQRRSLLEVRSQNGPDSLVTQKQQDFEAAVGATESYLIAYADTAKSHVVAMYALGLGKNQFQPDQLKNVMLNLAKRFADKPEVTTVTTDFFNYVNEMEKKSVEGKQAPEISLPGTDGKTISLSSFKGKYVLVDFWASWCGPCRQENPNVVAAYQNFKGKNFTVFGVSLDKDKGAWLKAIQDDKLTWTHASDLKFWSSAVVPLYNIEGIPFNVLVDPDGKIIASNLRGRALSAKLQSLLK